MSLVPEDAFRELVADLSGEAFAAFVADLWRARGHDVTRDGDRLHLDDATLRVVERVDPGEEPTDDERLVAATPLPEDAPEDAVGPADLRGLLLYGVERDRAAALFEEHFDRPLDGDWSGWRGWLGLDDDEGATDDEAEDAGAAWPTRSAEAVAGQVRTLAGDRRLQALVVAALLVGPAAWWGLFVHEPSVSAPDEQPFRMAPGDAPIDGSFRVTASAEGTVQGERITFERVHTYAVGNPGVSLTYWRLERPGDGRTTVQYHEGLAAYTRSTLTNGTRFRSATRPGETFAGAVVVEDARTVYEAEPTTRTPDATLVPSLPTLLLAELPYERAGTTTYEGRDVVRYVPSSGWMLRDLSPRSDPRPLRVRSAGGEVLVDDSGRLLYANVSARTVPADTWGDVLLNDSRSLSVTYRTEFAVERPERPPWVDGLRNRTGNVSG